MEGRAPAVARRLSALLALASAGLVVAQPAYAGSPPPIQIGISSQQAGPSSAIVGARIAVRDTEAGRPARPASHPVSRVIHLPVRGGAAGNPSDHELYPPLSSDSALARSPQPFGAGSFWYPIAPRRVCIYAPNSVLPCYTLVRPGGAHGHPALAAINPAAIAASVAEQLSLSVGSIHASPRPTGLTGAASWLWLGPAPTVEELTVSFAGETVTVSAEPASVEWQFGDGVDVSGGPGRPYRTGPPPADAVLHVYETRCLPGDQGRNPYVLASCGSAGYEVVAAVVWRISFAATGRVAASGTLPSRTTATSTPYAVTEARGFLISGSSK